MTLATHGASGRNRTCDLRRVMPAFLPLNYGRPSWIQGDSNPSPRRCHRRALPNELRTRRASGWSRTTVSGLSNRRLDRFSFRGIEQGEALLIFVVNYSFVIHDESCVCPAGTVSVGVFGVCRSITRVAVARFGLQDSNLDSRSQSPMSYRWTKPDLFLLRYSLLWAVAAARQAAQRHL